MVLYLLHLKQDFAEALRRVQDDGKYKNATVDKALANFTDKALDYFKFCMDNMDKTIC